MTNEKDFFQRFLRTVFGYLLVLLGPPCYAANIIIGPSFLDAGQATTQSTGSRGDKELGRGWRRLLGDQGGVAWAGVLVSVLVAVIRT
jgi:hypothetical protein